MKPYWKVLSQERVFHQPPWLTVTTQRVELPNGHIIDDYLLTERPDVGAAFCLTETNEVVFVEQYKHGLQDWTWDLPMGYLEPGEAPLDGAMRELHEETGYTASDWEPLCKLHYDPNRNAGCFHFYLARNATHNGPGNLDITEDIQVHLVPLDNLLDVLQDGRVWSSHSTAGIYAGYHRLRELGV